MSRHLIGHADKKQKRLGVAVRSLGSKQWCLVDCGEGTQHRLLHTSLSLATLRGIFITHIHGDHCYGLPGLLASAGMLSRTEELLIVGPPAIRQFVQSVLDTTTLRLPYPLSFIDVEEAPTVQLLPDFEVKATALSHRVPSFAYSFLEQGIAPKLDAAKLESDGIPAGPDWHQIQQGHDVELPNGRIVHARNYLLAPRKQRKIIVGGDNDMPSLLAAEAATADVLIHEATYTEDVLNKIGPYPQHSSARRTAQFAEDAGIKNLVLTHFSPRYQQNQEQNQEKDHEEKRGLFMSDIDAEARAVYSGNLFLANDLERYVLNKQGVLQRMAHA